jgi:hypothetical protein
MFAGTAGAAEIFGGFGAGTERAVAVSADFLMVSCGAKEGQTRNGMGEIGGEMM